ncbi:hypothetical protein JYI49_24395, partial [Escherichia fergusonii]|nr:hypothetical protein [Escherichia fergusonii]
KHSKQFTKDEESRSISYVSFSAAPSSADSAAVLGQITALKNDFEHAEDAGAYISRVGSEIPFYNSYFSKAKMQQPNKDSLTK